MWLTLVLVMEGHAHSSATLDAGLNQLICRGYGLTGGCRCMQTVDIYYSSTSITAPSLLASYLQSPHMAQHYSTQCFAACKMFTLITDQQIHFCKVWAEHAKANKNRGMYAKFYRMCLLFWISAKSTGRLVSLSLWGQHHIVWVSARTNILKYKWWTPEGRCWVHDSHFEEEVEQRTASWCKISILLFNTSSSIVDADMKMFSRQTLTGGEWQLGEELIPWMMEGVYEGRISGKKKETMSRGTRVSQIFWDYNHYPV